jgi:hypothetical protein
MSTQDKAIEHGFDDYWSARWLDTEALRDEYQRTHVADIARQAFEAGLDLASTQQAEPSETPDQQAICLAGAILTHLGYSTEPSLEPGADPRRDSLARFLLPRIKKAEPACSWPIQPLELVQVSINGISQMAQPERPYFSAHAMQELEDRKAEPAQAAVPASALIVLAECWDKSAGESRDQGWHTQADAFTTCAADARRAVKLAAQPKAEPVQPAEAVAFPPEAFPPAIPVTDSDEVLRLREHNQYLKTLVTNNAIRLKQLEEFARTHPAPAQATLTYADIVRLWGNRSDGPSNGEIIGFALQLAEAWGVKLDKEQAR